MVPYFTRHEIYKIHSSNLKKLSTCDLIEKIKIGDFMEPIEELDDINYESIIKDLLTEDIYTYKDFFNVTSKSKTFKKFRPDPKIYLTPKQIAWTNVIGNEIADELAKAGTMDINISFDQIREDFHIHHI